MRSTSSSQRCKTTQSGMVTYSSVVQTFYSVVCCGQLWTTNKVMELRQLLSRAIYYTPPVKVAAL